MRVSLTMPAYLTGDIKWIQPSCSEREIPSQHREFEQLILLGRSRSCGAAGLPAQYSAAPPWAAEHIKPQVAASAQTLEPCTSR
jgi:hypothetical protein